MSKKYLLTRFGGIGDLAPVTAVAKVLKDQGHEVHIAAREDEHGVRQVDLLQNTEYCDKAYTFREVGPWKTRCVSFEHGWVDIKSIYPDYDEVIDYMHIVEYNDTCHSSFVNKPTDEWKKHRNSNWRNWYDLHLEWANIDPTSISDEMKRPIFALSDEEKEVVADIRGEYDNVVVLNPHASSLARTWYQADDLIPLIQEKYPNSVIFSWKPSKGHWERFSPEGVSEYRSPIKSSLRASMCVVGAADIYVGADTGFTHVAESLGIPHIAIYSSVPWWTRAKYYKHQIAIDHGYPTFALTLGDPNRVEEGMDNLSDKEKKLIELHERQVPIEEAAKELNTTPEGVSMELQAVKMKIESFERIQSKALSKVTISEVFDKLNGVLEKKEVLA